MRWAAGGMGAGWVQRGTKEGRRGRLEGRGRTESLLRGACWVGCVRLDAWLGGLGRAGKGWPMGAEGERGGADGLGKVADCVMHVVCGISEIAR